MSNRAKAYLAMLSVSLIWGISAPVIKATLNYIPPITFLYLRFLILLPFVIPWFYIYAKKRPIRKEDLIPLTGIGLLGSTLFLSLLYIGLDKTSALDGTLLVSTAPLFIIFFGYIFLGDKVTKKEKIGILFVFIGSLITVIKPIIESGSFKPESLTGNILIILANIVWGIFILWSKKTYSRYPPLMITLYSAIIAAITFFPLAYLESNTLTSSFSLMTSNFNLMVSLLYMSFISYILAYYLYAYGMHKIEISEASLFSYLQPLFAAPIAVIFLKESITPTFLAGAAIIALGIYIAEIYAHK